MCILLAGSEGGMHDTHVVVVCLVMDKGLITVFFFLRFVMLMNC